MSGIHESRSEVARLLAQINAEYEAAERGLNGLASGTSSHEFITARTENIGRCHEQLKELVGPDKAIALLAETVWSSEDQGIVP